MNKVLLQELIHQYNKYPEDKDIYMKDDSFHFDRECFLLYDSEQTRIKGLKYIYGVYILKDIINNLKMQKPHFTIKDAIVAMEYYYLNDAFVTV